MGVGERVGIWGGEWVLGRGMDGRWGGDGLAVGKGMDGLCANRGASASKCWLRRLVTTGERWKVGRWVAVGGRGVEVRKGMVAGDESTREREQGRCS